MRYLLDTNTVSAVMAETPAVMERIHTLGALHDLAVASITRGEIRHGVARLPLGSRRSALQAKAAGVLAVLECLPVDEAAADAYAEVKADLERAGRPIGKDNDLWIAAVALANGCVLISAQKSFSYVPGLAVNDWTV